MSEPSGSNNYIELAADIVSAYVSNNSVPASELPALINDVHNALLRVDSGVAPVVAEALKPAVPTKKSITNDYIICLEDGKKFKSLKRHLRTRIIFPPRNIARNGAFRLITRWWPPTTQRPAPSSPSRWAWASSAAASAKLSRSNFLKAAPSGGFFHGLQSGGEA